jgi:hypothetical protein
VRIVKSVQTKVCVDGSLMKEFVLTEPLTEGFLKFLENFGTVRFLDQLKKPYFSFEKEHFISIKGFVGDSSVEVRYKKSLWIWWQIIFISCSTSMTRAKRGSHP